MANHIAKSEVLLTYEGLTKLENELEYLKTEKRKEVADKIKEARAFGDLSENSEYDEAKNEQGQVEARIVKLELMLKNAKVIDEEKIDTNVVNLATKVKVLDVETNEEFVYIIVGSTEADPAEFKISSESPVGKALLGRKVGDIVTIDAPGGAYKLKILAIAR
jgi:transcription elongation factor GreA